MSARDLFEKAPDAGDAIDLRKRFEEAPEVGAPPEPMKRGKALSGVLENEGATRALEAANKLGEGVIDELPSLAPRAAAAAITGPAMVVPEEVRHIITDPTEEGARARSAAAGMTLGLSAKVEGAARRLGGDPQGMAKAEDATAKAVRQYPVENLGAGALLPGGPELSGYGAVPQAVGRAATQGVYGGVGAAASGGDVPSGVAGGLLSSAVGQGLGATEKPLYSAAGKGYVRTIAPRAGIIDRLDREGVRAENVSSLGHQLQQQGLVPLLGGKDRALQLATGQLKELGPQYPALDKQFDAAVLASRQAPGGTVGGRPANAPQSKSTYNFSKSSAAARPTGLDPEEAAQAGAANRFADRLAQGGGGLGDARQQMAHAAEGADFRFKPPLGARLHREALGRGRADMLEQVDEVLGPEARASLEDLNRKYARAKVAQDLSRPAASREDLHQAVSPTNMLLAGRDGGLKAALLEPVVEAALRRSGALQGHALSALSSAASAAPKVLPAATRTAEEEEPWLDYFRGKK